MNNSAIDQCRELVHIRRKYQREPKFLYVAPDVYMALLQEMAQMRRYFCSPSDMEPIQSWVLYGCKVKEFNLPRGYILCSETRLH